MTSSKRRNWILIAVGIAVLIVFVGIGAILATTLWVQQNLSVTETNEGTADEQFNRVRQRFAGQPPMLDMRNDRPAYNPARTIPASPEPIERLHILAWDPDEGQLVSMSLPFWLLRLKSGPIGFGSYVSGLDDQGINVGPEDLEKYGPGIVLDTEFDDGERVLLWVQ